MDRARPFALAALALATVALPTSSAAFTATTASDGSFLASSIIAPPTDLAVTQTCAGSVPSAQFSWTPTVSGFAEGYRITRTSGPTFDVTPGSAATATAGGLADDTTYEYSVRTFAGAWLSDAVVVSISTDCTPTGVTGAFLLANTGGSGGRSLLTTASLSDTNPATNESNVGTGTGATPLDGLDIERGTARMLAVGQRAVGTVSPVTGLFSRIGRTGSARGADGNRQIDNLTGISFHPTTGQLWAIEDAGPQGTYLLRLDPALGQVVPDAFGAGVDYRVLAGPASARRADDLAIHPLTGEFFALLSDDGAGRTSTLVRIDPATGGTTVVSTFDPYEFRGLEIDAAGQMWAMGESRLDPAAQVLARINNSGAVTSTSRMDNGGDYRAVAIRTAPSVVAASPMVEPGSGSVALQLPVAAVPGDLALAWVGMDTAPISAPAGWTLVRAVTAASTGSGDIATNGSLFRRTVGVGDPGQTFTFTAPGASTGAAVIIVYRGVRAVTPVDVHSGAFYTSTISPRAPSVTPTVVGTRLVAIFHHEQPGTLSPPAGMTERFEAGNGTFTLEVADSVHPTADATGNKVATASSGDDGIGLLVALAPG